MKNELKKPYRVRYGLGLTDKPEHIEYLTKKELQEQYFPIEDRDESNKHEPLYLYLNPVNRKIVDKMKEKERASFWFRVFTTSIFAGINLSIGSCMGKHAREVVSIDTSRPNVAQIVCEDASTNLLYSYNGTYLPKEAIEKQIREQKENELEKTIQLEIERTLKK